MPIYSRNPLLLASEQDIQTESTLGEVAGAAFEEGVFSGLFGSAERSRELEQAEFGVVAAGARADLLLLDGDPGGDLSTLLAPAGVMARGRWFLEPSPGREAGPREELSPPGAAPPARASAGARAPSR